MNTLKLISFVGVISDMLLARLQFAIMPGLLYIRIPMEKTEDGYARSVDFIEDLERELAEKGIPHDVHKVSIDQSRIDTIAFSLHEAGTWHEDGSREVVKRIIYAENQSGDLLKLQLEIFTDLISISAISEEDYREATCTFFRNTAVELCEKEIIHGVKVLKKMESWKIDYEFYRIFFMLKIKGINGESGTV